ncbi:hypothetical protein HDU98_001700, partial [Podochytrium sp. JEL0797]
MAVQDDILDGVRIPKGTILIMSFDALHKNKEFWGPDADDFNPSHWLENPTTLSSGFDAVVSQPDAQLSCQTRNCIGAKFATTEIKALVAYLSDSNLAPAKPNFDIGSLFPSKPEPKRTPVVDPLPDRAIAPAGRKPELQKPVSKVPIPIAPLIVDDDDDALASRNKHRKLPKTIGDHERHPNKVPSHHSKKSMRESKEFKKGEVYPKKEKAVPLVPKDIHLPDGISVVNMGSLLGLSFEKLAAKMKELGFDYPTPDYVLNSEISSLIALEFGMNPIVRTASVVETNFKP